MRPPPYFSPTPKFGSRPSPHGLFPKPEGRKGKQLPRDDKGRSVPSGVPYFLLELIEYLRSLLSQRHLQRQGRRGWGGTDIFCSTSRQKRLIRTCNFSGNISVKCQGAVGRQPGEGGLSSPRAEGEASQRLLDKGWVRLIMIIKTISMTMSNIMLI